MMGHEVASGVTRAWMRGDSGGDLMLTSQLTTTIQIPGEPHTLTIRKLSHHQVQMARERAREKAIALVKALGDIKLPERPQSEADPLVEFDRDTVLSAGITGWSYDAPCTPETIADLDEDTAAWAFGEIIAFSLRSAAERKASASGSLPITTSAAAGQPN